MATLIAKGTAPSKTSGTTLSKTGISITSGNSLIVAVNYETGQGAPVVKWGFRELDSLQTQAQSGMATNIFVLRHINNTATRPVNCTWAGAIVAKVMVIAEIEGANILDVATKQGQVATGSPDTTSITTTSDNTFHVAAFGSRGPSSDTAGTAGSGHTLGERDGTVGAPPASNVTLQLTWEELTATGSAQATMTGATARDWANVIVALEPASGTVNQGVTRTDYSAAELKFEAQSLNFNNHAFSFNEDLNRWEVFDTDVTTTLVAHSDNGWA